MTKQEREAIKNFFTAAAARENAESNVRNYGPDRGRGDEVKRTHEQVGKAVREAAEIFGK